LTLGIVDVATDGGVVQEKEPSLDVQEVVGEILGHQMPI